MTSVTGCKKGVQELTRTEQSKFTPSKWKEFLRLTANGIAVKDAIKEVKVTRQTYEAFLAAEPDALEQYQTARQSWWRREWPLEKIEDVLMHIALGETMDQAFEAEFIEPREQRALYRILLKDPAMKQLYDDAREMQVEKWSDDIIQISDDRANDTYEVESKNGTVYTKTDHEVVNRSKLRVASRQWLMARLHHARFGDKIKQEIEQKVEVNHADLLTKARQRREKAHQKKMVKNSYRGNSKKDSTEQQDPPENTTH